MAKNIVVLGAGASKLAGAPLMYDFLDRAEHVLTSDKCGRFETDFKRVFKGVRALHASLAKARLDINNLESVFCAFEMAELCGSLEGLTPGEVSGLCGAMQNLILRTLELSLRFQENPESQMLPPVGYHELSQHLGERVKRDWTFVTFNYDLGLDMALRIGTRCEPDYGLVSKETGGQPLLKLHGSMNWQSNGSDSVEAIPIARLLDGTVQRRDTTDSTRWNVIVSDTPGFRTPVIVPPSWRKGDHYNQISHVWRRCAAELANAENLYFCGFSLPETDHFFRYLYAIGSSTESRMKSFVVFDPSEEVRDRYLSLLGQVAQDRFSFQKRGFDAFVEMIGREMKKV